MAAPRILVAEDEGLAAMALEDELLREGYAVTLAPDGLAALEAAAQEPPDLLLTDLRMPRLDGSALIRALRAARPDLPVVVMTGYAPAGGAAAFAADGEAPISLFAKPLDMDAVLAELRKLLNRP
ncbi:response regulator [Falsiroseomonas selenitidurans]|uniref:Response regulator n=1 Tax=Falsiroseomonas selenitidurans TaxID=2716335 RepID=A0ABX1E3E5_9PROT|nr:response regulator [Falsiroseomonas selenitidurans]NKC30037.1 response regulator [Falsiroseomonas selenitidurans]